MARARSSTSPAAYTSNEMAGMPCGCCAISASPRRCDGLFDGRAHRRAYGARLPRRSALAAARGLGYHLVAERACRRASPRRWKPRPAPPRRTRPPPFPSLRRTDQERSTGARRRIRCSRQTLSRAELYGPSRRRRWSRSGRSTPSPDPPRTGEADAECPARSSCRAATIPRRWATSCTARRLGLPRAAALTSLAKASMPTGNSLSQ